MVVEAGDSCNLEMSIFPGLEDGAGQRALARGLEAVEEIGGFVTSQKIEQTYEHTCFGGIAVIAHPLLVSLSLWSSQMLPNT